jgi:hypothetical protein
MKSYLQFMTEELTANDGLYSFRKLNAYSSGLLTEWMSEYRVPNPVESIELHCTVICSKASIPQYKLDAMPVMLNPATYHIDILGEALVLSFRSDTLHRQWLTANALGAQSRWPTFRPHITLSYKVPVEFQFEDLKPPPVPLVLDSEQGRVMVDGWAAINQVVESNDFPQLYSPEIHLNIPREKMPQIASDHVGEYIGWLEANNVEVDWDQQVASSLRSVQKDINLAKVAALSNTIPEEMLGKPLIVSNDHYILDGHHRWLAIMNRDPHYPINTYVVDLPIAQLLNLSKRFPKVSYRTAGDSLSV